MFVDEGDYRDYLQRLAQTAAQQQVQIHGYCLLPQAVWLLLRPADCRGLSALMQILARCASRRRGQGAAAWQGRFRTALVQEPSWLLPALVAVDRAAASEGLCGDAAAWPWSSLAHHAGSQSVAWLREAAAYWDLGNTPYAREAAYAGLLAADAARQQWPRLLQAVQGGWALGDAAYLEWAEARVGRALRPRPRGRPRRADD